MAGRWDAERLPEVILARDGYRATGESLGMTDDHGVLGHTANVEVRVVAAILVDSKNENYRSLD